MGRPLRRDERGLALPSPLVVLSVVAVVMAAIAFVVTQGSQDPEREVATDRVTPAATSSATGSASPSASSRPTRSATPRATPTVDRADVVVAVFNNSGIRGLAGRTAEQVEAEGWQVVGSDNWVGTIPASTVYYGPRLSRAAQALAEDLGIDRVKAAVDPMSPDRLTVILTSDYAS